MGPVPAIVTSPMSSDPLPPPQADVLLIDDDAELGDLLADYLGGFGITVHQALTPSQGLDMLRAPDAPYALVLLDVMLPERDGFTVCRDIVGAPEVYGGRPVIMLTARGDVIDRVVGLELGADDYLPKPFEPRELLARLRTVLRRATPPAPAPAPSPDTPPGAGLTIDRERQRVWVDGAEAVLTGLEFDLLLLLTDRPGRPFTRDEIMDALRGIEADIFSRAIDALVSRLRQKLGDASRTPRFIKTLWGRGYAYTGPPVSWTGAA